MQQLQDWIRTPTIAAEGRNVEEGGAQMMRLLGEAGFQQVEHMPTDGVPGVIAARNRLCGANTPC